MEDRDDIEGEDYDEQVEQMIVENGMLLHSVVAILLRKGVITQDELDGEMGKLYAEMDQYKDDDEE